VTLQCAAARVPMALLLLLLLLLLRRECKHDMTQHIHSSNNNGFAHSNRYNHNASAGDVACGSDVMTADEFKATCGVDVGSSSPRLPSEDEIVGMVRSWLGMRTIR
jgi:hypothetical protein